jgi:hypothetical protein
MVLAGEQCLERGSPVDMKMGSFKRTPSKLEFHSTTDAEFNFLVREYDFTKCLPDENDFEVRYKRDRCVVRIIGESYGQTADVLVLLDDQQVPWYFMVPDLHARLTAHTDAPQLDDIRESAARLGRYFSEFLGGDYTVAAETFRRQREAADERERRRTADPRNVFFSAANRLWKSGRWHELGSHLRSSQYELTAVWEQRLEEADAKSKERG